jgi:hypothetical protein
MADTPKMVALPQRGRILAREQFGESGLPGSELVRVQSKRYPSASEFSAARLALLGLAGAGIGAFAAHKMKKSKAVGGALGGALGGAASLLLPKSNDDHLDVVAAGIDAGGRGSILLVGASKAVAEAVAAGSGRRRIDSFGFVPVIVTDPSTKYPGWAGAILQHGLLVQRGMMSYIWDHAQYEEPTQVAPDYGFDTSEWGCAVGVGSDKGQPTQRFRVDCPNSRDVRIWSNCGPSASGKYEPDWSNKTLWTERFAEWPSPAFPRYGLDTYSFPQQCNGCVGMNDLLPGSVQADIMRQVRYIAFSRGDLGDPTRRANGQNLAAAYYAFGQKLELYKGNAKPLIDSYWTKNTASLDQFKRRYKLMMRRAQWFVWAAEMFRIHAGVTEQQLPGWKTHCMQWGVGCASTARLGTKETMVSYNSKSWTTDRQGKKVTDEHGKEYNPIRVEMKVEVVQEYIKLVMRETPPVFTTSPKDQLTIRHPDDWRWMLDMPDIVGAMQPPIDAVNCEYIKAIHAKRLSAAPPRSLKVFTYVFNTIVSIVSSYGGPAMMVAYSAMTFVMTVARLSQQDGKIDKAELCRAVGKLLADVAEATGAAEVAGETFEDAINSLGEIADAQGIIDELETVLDLCESIKDSSAWPYVDEFFGTVLDFEQLGGQDVEAALEKI